MSCFVQAFPRGGCWILKVKKKPTSASSSVLGNIYTLICVYTSNHLHMYIVVNRVVCIVGNIWQDMVFALIGESFEEPDVVGISVCIRK